MSADLTNIHRASSSISIPSLSKSCSGKKTVHGVPKSAAAMPFLRVDVIAPTPCGTPLPPDRNSNDEMALSIEHGSIKIDCNNDEGDNDEKYMANTRNAAQVDSSDGSSSTNIETANNDPVNRDDGEGETKHNEELITPKCLLETSFDQSSKPTVEDTGNVMNDGMKATQDHENDEADFNNKMPSSFLDVDSPISRQRELRSSIRSNRSRSPRTRLSIDHSNFQRPPLRSSFKSATRPDRKSLSLSIPNESTKVSKT